MRDYTANRKTVQRWLKVFLLIIVKQNIKHKKTAKQIKIIIFASITLVVIK